MKATLAFISFIEPLNPDMRDRDEECLAPLRRKLLTIMATLALGAMLAMAGFASSPPQESAPVQAQPATARAASRKAQPLTRALPSRKSASRTGVKQTIRNGCGLCCAEGGPAARPGPDPPEHSALSSPRDAFADIRAEAERTATDGGVRLNVRYLCELFCRRRAGGGKSRPPAVSQVINASKFQLGELFTQDHLDRALTNIKQLFEENGYYRTLWSAETE